MHIIPRVITKTVAATGTPEALGAETLTFTSVTFIGQKAYGTDNTTDVHIQLLNSSTTMTDALTVSPGQVVNWVCDPDYEQYFRASDFYIRVETNGDGLRAIMNALA